MLLVSSIDTAVAILEATDARRITGAGPEPDGCWLRHRSWAGCGSCLLATGAESV